MRSDAGTQLLQRAQPVIGDVDRVALASKHERERLLDLQVVLDDQDALGSLRRALSGVHPAHPESGSRPLLPIRWAKWILYARGDPSATPQRSDPQPVA